MSPVRALASHGCPSAIAGLDLASCDSRWRSAVSLRSNSSTASARACTDGTCDGLRNTGERVQGVQGHCKHASHLQACTRARHRHVKASSSPHGWPPSPITDRSLLAQQHVSRATARNISAVSPLRRSLHELHDAPNRQNSTSHTLLRLAPADRCHATACCSHLSLEASLPLAKPRTY